MPKPALVLLVLIATLPSCTKKETTLSSQEREVVAAVRMDPAVALKVRALGTSIERLTGSTEENEEAPADGIVLTTKPKEGRGTLPKVRQLLTGTPYRAYLRDDAFGTGPDKIAIASVDDYGYLAIVRTDGINYDIDHTKVMERYRQWDKKYGLKLVGAGLDWLEAEFTTPPSDWTVFAKEVYEFCPDVVDQGTGDVPSLASEMQRSKTVYLWWD
jgi:hypothetical protein